MRAELLAPAGSGEGLKAVIHAGADAVYIGGQMFGARAYAKNPEEDALLEGIDYAHLHGKKVYLTVNTLLKNRELEGQLYEYLLPYYRHGLDAVIVQDYGVLTCIRKWFPNLPVHASTQMAITGPKGAALIKEAGASRIVTARELSLKEIRSIYDETGVEIESFIHGALCYCYSGMCLFSSMLGGRSGNRGRCAQPCRLPYEVYENGKKINGKNQSYPMSPKDMCTIDLLPQILEAGVYSLKIEGRMKRPEYAAGVTRIYRKYLDLYEKNPKEYKVSAKDRQELLDLYQRDGFNQGYYLTHNGKEMMAALNEKEQKKKAGAVQARNEKLFQELKEQYLDIKKQEKINGNLILFTGAPAILNIECGQHMITVQGDVVEPAKNQPLSLERLDKQMRKTGNTPFVFDKLEIETDDAGFLPMQSLNELRREGLKQLEEAIVSQYRREIPKDSFDEDDTDSRISHKKNADEKKFYVSVETREQYACVLKKEEVDGIYASISMYKGKNLYQESCKDADMAHRQSKEYYLAFPYVLREERMEPYKEQIKALGEVADGFLIRNLESIGYVKELGLLDKAVTDYSLYTMNNEASKYLRALGTMRQTVPFELNQNEIAHRSNQTGELVVYGHYPMMISAQCFKKTCGVCDGKSGQTVLKDRYGQEFLTKCYCDFCYNVVYNSITTGFLKEAEQIKKMEFAALRMNFTVETAKETEKLLNVFTDVYKKGKEVSDKNLSFTKGHFKRGVE